MGWMIIWSALGVAVIVTLSRAQIRAMQGRRDARSDLPEKLSRHG
jgi:hypothetical protein